MELAEELRETSVWNFVWTWLVSLLLKNGVEMAGLKKPLPGWMPAFGGFATAAVGSFGRPGSWNSLYIQSEVSIGGAAHTVAPV